MLASLADVSIIVGDIGEDEQPRVERLIEEAGDVVQAYCRRVFTEPVPGPVARIVARMVARSITSEDTGLPVGASSLQTSAGPFSRSVSIGEGATDGGVWLTRQDKLRLAPYKGGAFTVRTW